MPKRSIDELTPNPRNPRTISKKKLAMLRESMAYYGDLSGIIQVEGGDLVGGHQRVEAYRSDSDASVEITNEYDPPLGNGTVAEGFVTAAGSRFAYRVCRWDADKAAGAALAANKGAGEWDMPLVAEMMGELDASGFDLNLTLFDQQERDSLLGAEEAPNEVAGEDDALEARSDPGVQPGDLFQLGDNFLLCGDSTNLADVERAMGATGGLADAVWTDPPYGVSYVGKTAEALEIENDGAEGLAELLRAALTNATTVCRPGAVWHVAAPAGPQSLHFSQTLTDLGVWRQTLVWVKNSLVMGHSDYHYKHEIIYYGWVPGASHQTPPDRKQDTVWEIARPTKSTEHPTMKPLALIEKALLHCTRPGDLVFEPFGGSGSTLMACEKLGRRNVSIELDPKYCRVILDRFERLFEKKTELVEQREDDLVTSKNSNGVASEEQG